MTGNRIVTKQQAGDEDLLLGEGQVTQVRNGVPVTVTKQRRIQPVNNQAELDALDKDKYKTALLIQNGTFSLKRATASGWVTVPAKDYDLTAVTAIDVASKSRDDAITARLNHLADESTARDDALQAAVAATIGYINGTYIHRVPNSYLADMEFPWDLGGLAGSGAFSNEITPKARVDLANGYAVTDLGLLS